MKADSKRWTQIEASRFAHEKEALDHLREALPDQEPYRGWWNLEFVARDGSINEVDTLVLTRRGLFLVEIKSRGGCLSGDAGTWTWNAGRREVVTDNPLSSPLWPRLRPPSSSKPPRRSGDGPSPTSARMPPSPSGLPSWACP